MPTDTTSPLVAPASDSPLHSCPRRWEWIALVILLSAFFSLNLATYNYYPQVWSDEVWFSEPPVNKVTEGEFHSRTFKFQQPHTFPILNCPLYMLVQVPWLAVAGTSVVAIRALNYLLMTVAAFLVWEVAWRFGLVRSPRARLLLVALLHLGYGMSFAYRCSRPDILGLVNLLLLALAFAVRRRRLREWAIIGLSAATIWVGLQVALFAGIAGVAAVLVLRSIGFRELFLVSIGLALGAFSLIIFLDWQGALANFLPPIIGMVGKRYGPGSATFLHKLLHVLGELPSGVVDELSTTVLLAGLGATLILGWRRLAARSRAFVLFCLVLVFGTPLVFDLLGHWAFYYSYLRFVPASLAVFATLSDLSQTLGGLGSRLGKGAILASVALAMAIGLPTRLFLTARYSQLMPRKEIQRAIQANVKPNDIVVSDVGPFYEVKSAAKVTYCVTYSALLFGMPIQGGHDFTPEERAAFTVAVLRADRAESVTNHLGGHWRAVTEPFGDTQDFSRLARLPLVGRRLASYAAQPQTARYQLQIFRRLADSAVPPGTANR